MNSSSSSNWFFSLKTYIAAMLALFTAFSLDLKHPYWTIMSAYLVSQPLAGAVRSKTFYRICGTFLGAAVSVALIPNFVNTPLLLSFVLALWTSFCLYISVLDRTPRGYAFLLAGYTVSIIAFPNVDTPIDIFDEAVSRFEEISLGMIYPMVIHTLVFPLSATSVFRQRLDTWWQNTRKLMQTALLRDPQKEQIMDWQNLANEITQLYLLSTHLAFDTANLQNPEYVFAIDERMSILLSTLYVIADRLRAIRNNSDSSLFIQLAMQRIELLVADDFSQSNDDKTKPIDEKINQATPRIQADSSWYEILQMSLDVNLKKLITLYTECGELLSHRYSDGKSTLQHIDINPSYRNIRPFHRDFGVAFASALATFFTIMSLCIFWIASAWPHGSRAALYAGIISCLFSSLPNAYSTILRSLGLFIVSVPIVAFYLFAVLTRVDGFFMLSLVLAPLFLTYGYLLAMPNLALAGLGSAGALAFSILSTIGNGYNSEFGDYINASMGLIIGIAISAFFNHLFRTPGEKLSIKRLLSAIQRDLSVIASQIKPADRTAFTLRTEDRLGLLIPFIRSTPDKQAIVLQGMKDLSVGLDIINLKSAVAEWADAKTQILTPLLDQLAQHYTPAASGQLKSLAPDFLQKLDTALTKVSAMAASTAKENALLGLCGLRRNLFSEAAPYQFLEGK